MGQYVFSLNFMQNEEAITRQMIEYLASLQLEFQTNKYRRLMTSTSIKRGQVVFTDDAIAFTSSRCICLKVGIYQCSICKRQYCSRECQKRNWKDHKRFCGLKEREEIELLVKTMEWLSTDSAKVQIFKSLVGHERHLSPDEKILFINTGQIVKSASPEHHMEDLITVQSKFIRNNFQIYDELLVTHGAGVYPVASLLNHSCTPNVVVLFLGTKMVIVALEDIEAGKELLSSYVDAMMPVEERTTLLKDRYQFECLCKLCVNQVKKVNPHSLGRYEWTKRVINDFCTEYQSLSFATTQLNLQSLHTIHDFPLYTSQLRELIEGGRWTDAAKVGEFVLAGYMATYHPYHPLVGIELLQHAKVVWNCGDDPRIYLRIARNVLGTIMNLLTLPVEDVESFWETVTIEFPE
jgi:hypothetical protein